MAYAPAPRTRPNTDGAPLLYRCCWTSFWFGVSCRFTPLASGRKLGDAVEFWILNFGRQMSMSRAMCSNNPLDLDFNLCPPVTTLPCLVLMSG